LNKSITGLEELTLYFKYFKSWSSQMNTDDIEKKIYARHYFL